MISGRRSWSELFLTTAVLPVTICASLAVATALECHAITGNNSLAPWIASLLYGVVLWMWWALVGEALWRAGKRWPATLQVSAVGSIRHLFLAVGVALVHLGILQLTAFWLSRLGPLASRAEFYQLNFCTLWHFGMEMLLYALVWFACVALKTQLISQQDAMRSLRLEKQLASAHLRALQTQIEPHFLFNTLNALTTLMELDRKEEALETLSHLNTILKTVLKRNTPAKIPLVQELEIIESYLAIERVRFADRLRVDMNLDPNALDGLVPCFLLQPIVENAIRHGVAHLEEEGYIETSAKRVGAHMQLCVRDNGPGFGNPREPGFGVGLKNAKERLMYFYNDNYEFSVCQPESGGFEVSITIPYEKKVS
jgi:sensor histidine kinase YesM